MWQFQFPIHKLVVLNLNISYSSTCCFLIALKMYPSLLLMRMLYSLGNTTFWVRRIPLSPISKTRPRAAHLLPTRIYSSWSGGTISCPLPFTTNGAITTSLSQTLLSLVVICLFRKRMAFLSHTSYDMQGLALLII